MHTMIRVAGVLSFAAAVCAAVVVGAQGNLSRGRDLVQAHRCLSCHTDGASPDLAQAPYIAGQKLFYLQKQLAAFRTSRRTPPSSAYKLAGRTHTTMEVETSVLSESDVADVAEYFANLPCVPRRSGAPDVSEAPAKAQRCTYCHGATGVNPYDIVPNLGGQKKEYLIEQLMALRASALDQPSQPDYERFHRMMAPSAFDLSDDEISGLADYYARQSCRLGR
jgi:cytochrome c553